MARIDTDLLGLQILALDSAMVVGEIDGLLIDDATLKVEGFLVDLGLYEASVLRFGSARAVGRDAVIVDSAETITDISADPALEALAEKDVTISDAKAITRSGRSVGAIGDFFVDTSTGNVVGMEFLSADRTVYPKDVAVIPASSVYRLGADIVVLQDDYDQHLLADSASLDRLSRPQAEAPAPVAEADTHEATESEQAVDTPEPEGEIESAGAPVEPEPTAESTTEADPEVTEEPEAGSGSEQDSAPSAEQEPGAEAGAPAPAEDTFTEQQTHFLVGKRVLRRIETAEGEIVAEEGDLVTYEMVQKAKSTDQLLILSLNVE